MIDIEKLKMTGILVGIRHKRNFSVLDRFGKIVDDVVDNSTSKFPKGYFDGVSVDSWSENLKLENLYWKLKNEYDILYKESNIEKTAKSNKVIMLILITSLILNIINFVVLLS